jgi:hypothetical protein
LNLENIEDVKKDKQFLKNLKDQEKRALFNHDIVELYDVLDMILLLDLDEDRLENIYLHILKIAFEDLKERLELEKKYKVDTLKDALMMRAVYERAIESWSNDDIATAKDIFLMLFALCDDATLNKSFAIHVVATLKAIPIDAFYENFVNNDDSNINEEFTNYDYFLKDFKQEVEQLMLENKEVFEQEINNFDPQKYSSLL